MMRRRIAGGVMRARFSATVKNSNTSEIGAGMNVFRSSDGTRRVYGVRPYGVRRPCRRFQTGGHAARAPGRGMAAAYESGGMAAALQRTPTSLLPRSCERNLYDA